MTSACPVALTDNPPLAPDTKRFSGNWLIYRKVGAGFSRAVGGARLPRFRHPTWDSAQSEAERLAALFPASIFIILQECGRIRMKPAESPDPHDSPRVEQDRLGNAPTLPVEPEDAR
jgi:hypothetical protein